MAALKPVCSLCGKIRLFTSITRKSYIEIYRSSSTEAKQKPLVWEPVIGLEIHAQIQADSKLFSRSSAKFGSPVNSQVAFLDAALPGTLPVLNRRCVEAGVVTALALQCQLNKVSRFDRKHYFYADLPVGYQITQQDHALANNGVFRYTVFGQQESDMVEKTVDIFQLQLEQDSGKSLHDELDRQSLIDLNRAGCALMEIVTAPGFSSGDDARSFVRDMRQLLITLGTCDGKMSEGSLRVDANISVHRPGEPLGVRTEVKNLNSMRSVRKAIDYEIIRQIGILEMGGEVVNETRSFDVETSETVPMRDKEVKQDYRFMPEPNLPPLRLYHSSDLAKTDPDIWKSKIIIDDLERSMPTLPRDKKQQLMDRYGISLYQATFIVGENLEGVYEELVVGRDAARFTQFFISEFISKLRALDLTWDMCAVPSTRIGELFDLRDVNKVSPTNGQWVLKAMLTDPEVRPAEWVESRGLWQITDIDVLTRACRTAIEDNPNAARKYLRGKARGMATLMGAARRGTENRADSLTLNRMLRQMLADKAEESGNDADSKGK